MEPSTLKAILLRTKDVGTEDSEVLKWCFLTSFAINFLKWAARSIHSPKISRHKKRYTWFQLIQEWAVILIESLLIFVSYIFAFLQMKLFFIPLYVVWTVHSQAMLVDWQFHCHGTSVNWTLGNRRELRSEALLGKAQNRGLPSCAFSFPQLCK